MSLRITRSLVLVALVGCAAHDTGDATAVMAHVRALADPALGGRLAGTDGERLAVDYVEDQLRADGLEPEEQDIDWMGSRNVYAVIPGASDEIVVVGAHLDHLGTLGGRVYPGADDDASGVAVVLEVAHALAGRRLDRTVVVVLFGAEEEGEIGSRYFVDHPPVALSRIVAMVNVDMVARPLLDQGWARLPLHLFGVPRERAVGLVGVKHYPGLRALADRAFAGVGEAVAPEDLPGVIEHVVERLAADRSDNAPFEARGIPALFFGDAMSSDYHQPGDTIAHVHAGLLARNARGITRVVEALAAAPAAAFARSERDPPKRKPRGGWYAPLGILGGYAGGRGGIVGGELALVHVWAGSLTYAGVYADVTREPDRVTRITAGPEYGHGWLGVDAGVAFERDGGAVRRGLVARVFATASVLSLGVRAGWLSHDGAFGEVDVLVKVPLRL